MSKAISHPRIATSTFEQIVMNHLEKIFSDQDQIYFKPFLNGDTPDFLILQKDAGVILVDICQLKLDEYTAKDNNALISKKSNQSIMSPIKKLSIYKNNLFDIHIDGLLQKKVQNKGFYRVIKNIVVFENETDHTIANFFKSNNIEYTDLLGKDSLSRLKPLFPYIHFTGEIQDSFSMALKSEYHSRKDGKLLQYTKKQKELSVSKNGEQKIKGVAGSGKTYVLAKRAVNAHIRTKDNVLILTYNKSLKQYIRYRLNEIEEDFNWQSFYINHYHGFMRAAATDIMKTDADFDDENVFDLQKDKIKRYKAIFIDEIQDYKTQWLRILKKYFLDKDGEFVVFGDEKQNIYDRQLDNNQKVNTTIPGRWSELKEGYRFNGKIVDLTNNFQKEFMSNKYEIEEMKKQPSLDIVDENIDYTYFDKDSTIRELAYAINQTIKKQKIDMKEVSIIASNIKFLQELDYILRNELKRDTHTVFETKEYLDKYGINKIKIDEIRNYKKSNFDIYADAIKLSTIHSFKGFEAESVFMVLSKDDINSEMIYTAFTRCSKNLFVINVDNPKYNSFFRKNVTDSKSIQSQLSDDFVQEKETLLLAQNEQESELSKSEIALSESNKKVQDIQNELHKLKNENQQDQERIEKYQRILKEEELKRKQIEADKENKIMALQAALSKLKMEKNLLESSKLVNKELEELKEFTSKILEENIELEKKYNLLSIKSPSYGNSVSANDVKNNFTFLKGNDGKFKICILGEISGQLSLFNKSLQDVLEKFNINPTEWKIEQFNNKNIPDLRKLKRGQSGYHLIVNGQIHHHSSKGNSSQNLLAELSQSNKYVPYRKGTDPKKVLTVDVFIDNVMLYLNEEINLGN